MQSKSYEIEIGKSNAKECNFIGFGTPLVDISLCIAKILVIFEIITKDPAKCDDLYCKLDSQQLPQA